MSQKVRSRRVPTSLQHKGRLMIFVAIVIAVMTFIYLAQYYRLQTQGIAVVPSGSMPVRHLSVKFQQDDPAWGSERIGDSGQTMAEAGSAVTCVSISMREMGLPGTPGDLCRVLTEAGAFKGTEPNWDRIHEIVPTVECAFSGLFTWKDIDFHLKRGCLPMVMARDEGTNNPHWLLVLGTGKDGYVVFDPQKPDGQHPLRDYGNIYAYRAIIPSE